MLQEFEELKRRVKPGAVCIDHAVFQLHYKVTCTLLLGCTMIITAQQYVGDPIVCLDDGRVPPRVLDAYCLMSFTFTVPNKLHGRVGVDMIQPGVSTPVGGDVKYVTYYQWVCFCLFLQACMFCLPRRAWKVWEEGRMEELVAVMKDINSLSDFREGKKKLIVKHITECWNKQNFYAIKFFFCEVLNLVNVVGQLFIVNYFLSGEFWSYGLEVIHLMGLKSKTGVTPVSFMFPKEGKCDFPKYGSSGTVQLIDALCLLPLNNVYDKVYFIIWCWFLLLAAITSASVFHRCLVYFVYYRQNCLRTYGYWVSEEHITTIVRNCQLGDWFVLYQLGKNINPFFYHDILTELGEYFEKK